MGMTALIFALIKENYVAEQGARMVSMDGASKNAGDMIDKPNLSFNRMRQAVITTELSEIISGMMPLSKWTESGLSSSPKFTHSRDQRFIYLQHLQTTPSVS